MYSKNHCQIFSPFCPLASGPGFLFTVFTKSVDFLNTSAILFSMTTKPIPACILVRVSTSKQETARQISELQAVASGKGWDVVEICEETISGRADSSERAGLQHVEAMARAGKIKKVLVHEISRIARRSSVVHSFVEMLEDCGVSLYWHSQGMETMLANGKRNPATGIMLAMLAEMAPVRSRDTTRANQ